MDELVAAAIFAVALTLILSDRLHRTIVALCGAVVMVVAGRLLGFYNEAGALSAVDFTTIGLLLGMMILVAMLQPTGFFEYVALRAGRLSKGRPFVLFLLLGTVTAFISMFLDNVTTVIVIAPATLVIARVLGVKAAPLLIAEAMMSNIGGICTLIGDPPNILIGSAAGLSFNDFLTHLLPVMVPVWVSGQALLWLLFRKQLGGRLEGEPEVAALHPSEALKQPVVAWRVLGVLGGAVVMFFLQDLLNINPAFIALGAAGVALLVVRPDVPVTLRHVEWSVLLFFSALFVMVGGLEQSGALEQLAEVLGRSRGLPPVLLGIILIWAVAIISSVVDNIPITIALIPVIAGLESSGIAIEPLWWALALGAGLGGNGTIIGASANVVVVSMSERSEHPIRSREWMRAGLPMLVATCTVASVFYLLLYPLLSR